MRDEELEIDKEAIVKRKEFIMIEVCAYCECGGPVPPHAQNQLFPFITMTNSRYLARELILMLQILI